MGLEEIDDLAIYVAAQLCRACMEYMKRERDSLETDAYNKLFYTLTEARKQIVDLMENNGWIPIDWSVDGYSRNYVKSRRLRLSLAEKWKPSALNSRTSHDDEGRVAKHAIDERTCTAIVA